MGAYIGIPIEYIQNILTTNSEEAGNIVIIEDYTGREYAVDLKYLTEGKHIIYDDINDKASWEHIIFEETQTAPNPVREPIIAIYELNGNYYFTRAIRVKNTNKYYIIKPNGGNLIGILGYYTEYNANGTIRMIYPVVFLTETLSDWTYFPVLEFTFENGRKLYIYSNIPVWIIIAAVVIAGIGVSGWAISQVNHSEAEKLNAQANIIRSENEKTAVQIAKDTVEYVKNEPSIPPEKKAELVSKVLDLLKYTQYTNRVVYNPPSPETTNTTESYNEKKNEWWSAVLDWIKENWIMIPTMIGVLVILLKFKIIQRLLDWLRERR